MVRASRNVSNGRRAAASDAGRTWPLAARIRNDGGVTRVDVYDDVGEDALFGGGISASDFVSQVAGVRGALECHINSGGGDLFDGIAIFNALRSHKGRVTTVVDGLAASIASVIAQAGQDRVAAPGSMVMIHDASALCYGNAGEFSEMAGLLAKVSDNLAGMYAGRCGGPPASWRAAMQAETWYTADEAVAAGLADRVGSDAAELPGALDLAALGTMPDRIAARLRSMPRRPAAGARRPAPAGPVTPEMAEIAAAALRVVRDELGPLPSRDEPRGPVLPSEWRALRDQARKLGPVR